jgi:DNA transformation protein
MKKKNNSFVMYVLDQMRMFRGVTSRAMFGGHGLYKDGIFFAAVAENRLFFRVSDETRPRYEERGMPPFAPYEMKPMRSYYEVPSDVLESPPQIVEWAEEALTCARVVKMRKKLKPKKNQRRV